MLVHGRPWLVLHCEMVNPTTFPKCLLLSVLSQITALLMSGDETQENCL
jgi:hypothetical protein